ncbi:vacuolar cation/proton exchanger 3-like [Magnolia sinica]|uniref:vacuolar cation/proton exchanger 3-like n=1 Tax=Magnolia sinica TaxID=86752 RepID=UPI00265B70F2|nr:vacuolar cation/proton exchanger 3-like [Magnolia sinica]
MLSLIMHFRIMQKFQQLTCMYVVPYDSDDVVSDEKPVIGFTNAFGWLVGMMAIIDLLSEYVVGTIEDAFESWGLSVSFISIILLPIVGNVAKHAGAIIFAFKNKLVVAMGFQVMAASFNLPGFGALYLSVGGMLL